jgi:hypothetical protein
MSFFYKANMAGVTLSDPQAFLKAVFPQWDGQESGCDGSSVWVKFDSPQTPADLGPLVKVVEVSDLFANS